MISNRMENTINQFLMTEGTGAPILLHIKTAAPTDKNGSEGKSEMHMAASSVPSSRFASEHEQIFDLWAGKRSVVFAHRDRRMCRMCTLFTQSKHVERAIAARRI